MALQIVDEKCGNHRKESYSLTVRGSRRSQNPFGPCRSRISLAQPVRGIRVQALALRDLRPFGRAGRSACSIGPRAGSSRVARSGPGPTA